MGKKRKLEGPFVEYTLEFAGLRPGDSFEVDGEVGNYDRPLKFKFSRLARSAKSGKEWVEAWDDDNAFRAFKPEKVKV